MSIIGKFLKIAGKDPNGNAKGVAVTENGEVKVRQTGSIVASDSEIYSDRIFQTIPASTRQEILPANNKYTIIDRIEFQTEYENPGDIFIHLRLKQSGGNYASYNYYFGSTKLNAMNNISTFKTIAEETNNFIVGTTREIIAPFGFKLEFENSNTTEAITVRTAYTYRELM